MASGRLEFHAESIMQHSSFCFVLPNDVSMEEVKDLRHYDRPPKSLILLHGLTGTDTDWLYGGLAQEMAIQYNLAVFMPTTGNSFYLDRGYPGGNYCEFVGKEFPEYIRSTFGYCMTREDTIIAGLSMGGYGALHTAMAHPDNFYACIALSSALVVYDYKEKGERKDDILPKGMVRDIFGDVSKIVGSDKDPEHQYKMLKEGGKKIPSIYLAIGTEDTLIDDNLKFKAFLEKEGADFFYEDGPGKHNWTFWNEYLTKGLEWVFR